MNTFGSTSGKSHYTIKTLALACVVALQACGGGGGGGVEHANDVVSANDVQQPETGAVNTTTDTTIDNIAQLESISSVPASAGWVEPTGVSMVDISKLTGWGFYSQKATYWTPGSVQLQNYADASTAIALKFDFGCTTSAIITKDIDCRNVVSIATKVSSGLVASNNAVIALTLRNIDAAAEYALRVTDSSGQTLQYPIQMRTIETKSLGDWAKVRVPLKFPTLYWGGNNNGVLSGTILNVALVASPRNSDSAVTGLNYPAGLLEMRSAQYFPASGLSYKLQQTASVNAAGLIPSIANRLIVASGSFDLTLMAKAKEAGFSGVRRDLLWEFAEPSDGKYVFDNFSDGVNHLNQLGMKVLWILDYGNPLHGGSVPTSSADMTAYIKFLKAAAEFGKSTPLLGYEIWNEPNLPAYWPTPNPVAYGNLLTTAVGSIRSVDASIPIASGGLTIDDPAYLFKLAKSGALSAVDAIGIHPYRKDIYVTQTPSFRRTFSSPEMYANDRVIVKNYLKSVGISKPIWNTESGYSTVFFLDPIQYPDALSTSAKNRQATLVLRSVLTQIAVNEPLITVFKLKDAGVSATDKEMNFGLLDAAGNEKPAFVALKTLNGFIRDKSFNGPHADVPPGMHALRWSNASSKVVCLWVDTTSEDISVTLPADAKSVYSWNGTKLAVTAGQVTKLSEVNGPIYVVF